jgi:1-acyl-sn-glycerol-3-phosphate acyltransferase
MMTVVIRSILRILLRLLGRCNSLVFSEIGPGPRILVANHESLIDGLVIWANLPGPPALGVLEAEHSERAFGHWLIAHGFAVRASPHRPFALRSALTHLRAGGTVLVFPEGKITVTGSLMSVYPGAAWLAARAGVPLQAISIAGSAETAYSYLATRQRRRWRFDISFSVGSALTDLNSGGSRRSQRIARPLLSSATERLIIEAMATNPHLDRPLAGLLAAQIRRFGAHRVLMLDGRRQALRAPDLKRRRALPDAGPARILAQCAAAWKRGHSTVLPATWWGEVTAVEDGLPPGVIIGGRRWGARELLLAEAQLRRSAGIRIGDRLFVGAGLDVNTFCLAVLSPLLAGTLTIHSSAPGVPVRPWMDDMYDRDADVLLLEQQQAAVLGNRSPDLGVRPHLLRSVVILGEEGRRDVDDPAAVLRATGVWPIFVSPATKARLVPECMP